MTKEPSQPDSGPTASEAGTATRHRDGAIRRASVSLFFDHGYNAVGIRQIAEAVSMNSATLYHYYPSKRALLESIMEDSNRLVLEDAVSALDSAPSPGHRFAYLAGSCVAAQVSNPKTCYIADNELRAIDRAGSTGQNVMRLRREYEELWREELSAALRRGSPASQDEHVTRLGLLGMLTSTSLWYRPNDAVKAPDLCLRIVDLVLSLIGRDPLTEEDGATLVQTLSFSPWPWEPPADEGHEDLPWFADVRTS